MHAPRLASSAPHAGAGVRCGASSVFAMIVMGEAGISCHPIPRPVSTLWAALLGTTLWNRATSPLAHKGPTVGHSRAPKSFRAVDLEYLVLARDNRSAGAEDRRDPCPPPPAPAPSTNGTHTHARPPLSAFLTSTFLSSSPFSFQTFLLQSPRSPQSTSIPSPRGTSALS